MTWLPWHVDPCCGGRFNNRLETDGTTYAFICEGCDELIADLICGAEP